MVSEMQSTWIGIAIHPWTRIPNSIAKKIGTPGTI